jgi:hypothetical protein
MLEVANFEHARFGVLSQCYSFRHFTATDPNFAFQHILAEIHTCKTKAPQTRLSLKALVEQPPPWKAVFSASASELLVLLLTLSFRSYPIRF